MTALPVGRSAEGIEVGDPPAHPEQTALLEARGAHLYWDVLAPTTTPSALVHDPERAVDWLWELYGTDAAAAILAGADTVLVAGADAGVTRAAHDLAHLGWARAWWPASVLAGVPALDRTLLAAETAVLTAAVEHLLDDEDAVERALAGAWAVPGTDQDTDQDTADLAAAVAALAEDYGVGLPAAPAPARAGFALAAGTGETAGRTAAEITAARGSAPVDWALVPAGTVDAAAEASWAIVRRAGDSTLRVSVPRAPAATGARLAARFGQVDLALDQVRADAVGGSTAVPTSVLLAPASARVLTVYAPEFTGPLPDAGTAREPGPATLARRSALVALARTRLTSAEATRTERAAGR